MTDEYRNICVQQQDLYECVQKKLADVYEFSEAFLQSDYCNRHIDAPYDVHQYDDIVNWFEFLEMENIVPMPKQEQIFPVSCATAGWIGFMYRYIQIETGIASRELRKKVPFEKLAISYPGLHTVDEQMAFDIIKHDFSL